MVVQADGLTVAANVVGSHYDSGGGSFAAGICGWFEQMDSLFNSVKWTERQVKGEECEERGIEKKGLRKEKVNAIGVKHVFCHVHITGATMVPLPITTSSEALLSLSLSLSPEWRQGPSGPRGSSSRRFHKNSSPSSTKKSSPPRQHPFSCSSAKEETTAYYFPLLSMSTEPLEPDTLVASSESPNSFSVGQKKFARGSQLWKTLTSTNSGVLVEVH